MKPRPMIAVADVAASSRWYQRVLGLTSAHGGDEYEMLMDGDQLALQLHRWEAHEHPHLGDAKKGPVGNGIALWFHEPAIVAAWERARAAQAEVLVPLKVNPLARSREFWLRDPDGYVVVIGGDYGDMG